MKIVIPVTAALIVFGCSRAPVPTVAEDRTPARVEAEIKAALEPPPGPVGRYLLLAATHQVVSKKAQYENKDVFRIDTATGITQVLVDRGGSGGDFWAEIEGAPAVVAASAQKTYTVDDIVPPPAPAKKE